MNDEINPSAENPSDHDQSRKFSLRGRFSAGLSRMKTRPNAGVDDWKQELLRALMSPPARYTLATMVLLVLLRLGVNAWMHRIPLLSAQAVRISPVELLTIDKNLKLPGNVEAIEQATLYAHVSGYLKKIYVDEGDQVKKDQLLAVIEAPDITQEYSNAKADYSFREVTRKRYEDLLRDQVVSQQEYDKIKAEADQAKARFDNAAANLAYTSVRAPFAGSIARRFRYPGDFISAPAKGGQASALFVIVNEGELRIAVNVPQSEIAHTTLGHPVQISVDAFPGVTFDGAVSRVDALLDEATKTQRILIDIANPDTRLRAGMFASVQMQLDHRENVPMIAKDAVHAIDGQNYVFVVKDSVAKKVAVTLGESKPGKVELKSPTFAPDDRIVVSGGGALTDGMKVKAEEVVPSGTPASPLASKG